MNEAIYATLGLGRKFSFSFFRESFREIFVTKIQNFRESFGENFSRKIRDEKALQHLWSKILFLIIHN
jgi:hypothetical protein